ncbi:head decoration protein [Sinorhizobium meliloti]|uniref:head decoration protein n=1 Tax=Rhizobium meliloti TaxID=382 RepID=UPI000FD6ED67|nr:head decoration protein [Sinorhizobium meliloti]RVL87669.1 head decoration protein [Sinorhizobium meliloti]
MVYTAPKLAGNFVLVEVHEILSRDEYTLKQDAAEYKVGTLVISEYATGAKTGKYVRATQTLVDAEAGADFAVVFDNVDASAADTKAAVFHQLGVVKGANLVLDASITVAETKALLAKQTIKVL